MLSMLNFRKVLFTPPMKERRRQQVIVPDSESSFLPAATVHTQLHKHRHCRAAAHPRNHLTCVHVLIYYQLLWPQTSWDVTAAFVIFCRRSINLFFYFK